MIAGKGMAVFRYKARKTEGEEFTESGTIRAKDESAARAKLNQYGFSKVRLKQVRGLAVLWKRFTADIK